MGDDGLTNLAWLVRDNPIGSLIPDDDHHHHQRASGAPYEEGPPTILLDYSRERSKPPYSYAQLITMAMQAHGGNRVLLSHIYQWIRENFAYFRQADTSWQNSVRHNLSLNKQFVKVPRDPKDKGKGSYWKLDSNGSGLPKDPYCLRRRNFADSGSARRQSRPEVSRPQVNPAVRTFLERVRRVQEARRHPFAGVGESLEDNIGAQECVYADQEPLFHDSNRRLFKKDVEQYDPLGGGASASGRGSPTLALPGLVPLVAAQADGPIAAGPVSTGSANGAGAILGAEGARVRVEYNWEAYEYHPAAGVGGAQLPLVEPLRIPTPDWWTTNPPQAPNLLLSPSNPINPMARLFENLNPTTISTTSTTNNTIIAKERQVKSTQDEPPLHPWSENGPLHDHDQALLLDLDLPPPPKVTPT